MTQGTITDPKFALAYVLQPRRNEITLRSAVTGNRITFRVNPLDKNAVKEQGVKDQRFFVKYLFGQDNENDYRYLGQILNGAFTLTQKSRNSGLNEQTPAYIAFKFAFDCFSAGKIPATLEVFHSGRCGRCGRKLTVPQSVQDGFGPECVGLVMGAIAPCPLPQVEPVKVAGAAVGQRGLDFPTAGYTDIKLNKGGVRMYGQPGNGKMKSGFAAAAALYAPAKATQPGAATTADGGSFLDRVTRVDNLDTEIRRRVDEYRVNEPENYFQDGMLEDKEAFNVAYNKFRVELTQGVK